MMDQASMELSAISILIKNIDDTLRSSRLEKITPEGIRTLLINTFLGSNITVAVAPEHDEALRDTENVVVFRIVGEYEHVPGDKVHLDGHLIFDFAQTREREMVSYVPTFKQERPKHEVHVIVRVGNGLMLEPNPQFRRFPTRDEALSQAKALATKENVPYLVMSPTALVVPVVEAKVETLGG